MKNKKKRLLIMKDRIISYYGKLIVKKKKINKLKLDQKRHKIILNLLKKNRYYQLKRINNYQK